MSKSVIACATNNIPKLARSHNLGWAKLWQRQLSSPDMVVDGYDVTISHDGTIPVDASTVYVYPNVNGRPEVLNLFGGANQDTIDRVSEVAQWGRPKSERARKVMLDFHLPVGELLRKRIGPKSCSELTTEWCDFITGEFDGCDVLTQEDVADWDMTDHLVIGDSHSLAWAPERCAVLRNDGKTLHGALTAGLDTFVTGINSDKMSSFEDVLLVFGSIDIRHHVIREGVSVVDMVDRYVGAGFDFAERNGVREIKFGAPVPVEFEGRRIAKSGWYKGSAFSGSMEQRAELTDRFIECLKSAAGEHRVVTPPSEWYAMDPEEYSKTIMESGPSFHVAPTHYRVEGGWSQ